MSMYIIKNIGIVTISSKYKIASRIASALKKANPYLTVVVINTKNKEVSIRGVLTTYLCNKLLRAGYNAGGHYGFGGISLTDDQDGDKLVEDIKEIV